MPTPDQRRPRRVWPWALVALALVVPLALFLEHRPDSGNDAGDSSRLTSSSPSAPSSSSATPAQTPSTTPSPSAVASPPPAKGKTRALFFGDSYFIGGGYTDESNSMARIASDRLGWSSEINGGGGTGFVQANPEYDLPNFLGQIDNGAFDVGKRTWVVIEGGNDDLYVDRTQLGRNVRKVLRLAQRRFPDAKIVLLGPLDIDGDFSDTTPVAKIMRKAARKRQVSFIDGRRWLEGHYDLIGPDYTHPYAEGHLIWAKKLTRNLRRLGA